MKSRASIIVVFFLLLSLKGFSQRTLDTNLPVGFTEGSYAVSPSGAATYSIPIYAAPGTAGMVPRISINYNSQSGLGPLGIGWSIAGLSSIDRCGKSYFYDQANTEISNTNSDWFQLDGNRMVLISGSYGGNDAVYAGESENFDKIVSYGTAGSGPEKFKVFTKDGLTMEYGGTPDSRIEVIGTEGYTPQQGTVRSWKLNKISDQSGNYMTFEYIEEGGAAWISKISYTGNAAAGLTPYNSIEFSYISAANNPGKRMIYQGGAEVLVDKLIDYIAVKCESSQFKRYDMVYSGTQDIRLTEIVEYGSDNSHFNSTYIEWSPLVPTITAQEVDVNNAVYTASGDFNNDGFSDFIYTTSGLNWVWNIRLGSATGLGNTVYSGTGPDYITGLSIGDVNGDGKDNVFFFTAETPSLYTEQSYLIYNFENNTLVNSSGGTVASTDKLDVQVLDFNGDGPDIYGQNDYVIYTKLGGYVVYSYPISQSLFPSGLVFGDRDFAFDFNGNGKTDLVKIIPSSRLVSVYEYDAASNSFITLVSNFSTLDFETAIPGDFNGDGRGDLLMQQYDYEYIYYSTGKVFRFFDADPGNGGSVVSGNNFFSDDYVVSVQDFNGDGSSDILQIKQEYHYGWEYSYYSNDFRLYNYFSNYIDAPILESVFNNDIHRSYDGGLWDPSKAQFGDFNGDGKTDIFTGDSIYYFMNQDKGKTVSKIYNGLNDYVQFNYKTLAQDDEYSTNNVSTPYLPFNYPMQIAYSVTVPDGIGSTNTTWFNYSDGALHPELGFTGFGKVSFKNSLNIRQTTEFKNTIFTSGGQKHFYVAPVKQSVANESAIPVVSLSQTDINTDSVALNLGKSFYTYEKNIVSNDYLKSVKTSANNYIDAATGNIINASVKYFNSGETVPVKTDSVYKTYTTFGSWHVASRVSSEKTIQTQRGKTAYSRQVNYDYNDNGILWHTTQDPSKALAVNSVFDTFNSFGSPTHITVSATGINSRTSNVLYDTKGRFIVSKTNPLSHTSTTTWDSRWGKPLTETGIDGQTVEYAYDAYGRLSNFTNIYDTVSTYGYHWCSSPENAVYFAIDAIAGAPDETRYYDLKNRKIRTLNQVFDGQPITDVQYNTHGQLYRASKPHFGTPKWITYSYNDAFGRKTSEQEQDLTAATWDYNGNTITYTNPGGQVTETLYDAAGRVQSVEDDMNGLISYKYNSNGNPDTVITNGSNTLMQYDDYANRHSLSDPDAGTSTFIYDALGQLISETDAKSQTRTREYNGIGQIKEMEGPEGITTYSYSPSGVSKEKLSQITGWDSNTITYAYDTYGRLSSDALFVNAASKTMTQSYAYDAYGRLSQLTYPGGFAVKYAYNTQGIMFNIKRGDTNSSIWTAVTRTAMNQPMGSELGNGMVEGYSYDNYDNVSAIAYTYSESGGTLSSMDVDESTGEGDGLDATILSTVTYFRTSYTWNSATRNLTTRSNTIRGLSETFTYDDLNRLTNVRIGTTDYPTGFNINGNIESKYDAGTYSYGSQPHAVSGISAPSGSAISTVEQKVYYNPFNKVKGIRQGTDSLTIAYSPAIERCMQKEYESSTLKRTIYYFHNYEEYVTVGVLKPTKYHYIYTPDGLVAIMKQIGTTKTMQYAAKDHLGSVMALYSDTRTLIEEFSYDAWGRRRNPTNWTYTSVPTATNTRHGYTGHEHLDKFALINMNGRVYDPIIGRFLSPDPYIQAPYFAQNFDRYSYVWNNPLKYVDPSGYKADLRRWFYYHVFLYMKRQTSGLTFDWDDPFTTDDPWVFGASTGGGGGGGGAPAGGSAASGPGAGGHGGGAGAPLDLGGDGGQDNPDGYCIKHTLINNSKHTIYYKPDTGNDWDALPLRPGESICTPVDGINVNGKVYKIADGYDYVLVNESNKVEYKYPWYYYFNPGVNEVNSEWLHKKIFNEDGSKKYYEYPVGSGNYYWDTQWWNIFFPYFQISDPRH